MGLLPLFLRLSDQTQSVAKVQLSKLSSGAGKRAPAAWARARPSFLRAGSPQEQSQEWGTPSLLPRAMVPSPIFCCSVGLWGSPPGCGRAPGVEPAQAPGADPAGVEDRQVLGEDNPPAPGPRLGEGCSLGLSNGGCWRRACSGRPGRLCDVAVPVCSLQLARDRSRAEEYVEQSLPYLRDAQAPVREAAVRFIGEPLPPVPPWAARPQGPRAPSFPGVTC